MDVVNGTSTSADVWTIKSLARRRRMTVNMTERNADRATPLDEVRRSLYAIFLDSTVLLPSLANLSR